MEVQEEGKEEETLRGLLSGLRLSEAERRGIKGTWLEKEKGSSGEAQAVGKLFAEKPGNAEGIAQSLGKIWCPIKGIHAGSLVAIYFLLAFCNKEEKEGHWRRVLGSLVAVCL